MCITCKFILAGIPKPVSIPPISKRAYLSTLQVASILQGFSKMVSIGTHHDFFTHTRTQRFDKSCTRGPKVLRSARCQAKKLVVPKSEILPTGKKLVALCAHLPPPSAPSHFSQVACLPAYLSVCLKSRQSAAASRVH